jgi:ubiquinone/menaquinone biosynthesis C-methylase UbiE
MLSRELEPEVMDDPIESQAYDEMDHAEVNRKFVQDLLALGDVGRDVLDLGTGTARIPIELCASDPKCQIVASDAAASMLDIASKNIDAAQLNGRIRLHRGDAKQLPFEDGRFDSVISNSLIHHVPEPRLVLAEMLRVVRPGGRLFIRDLMRPASLRQLEQLVADHAGREPAASQQLFRQSLRAALTLEEMQFLVSAMGCAKSSVYASSDRHWTWACCRRARASGPANGCEPAEPR